MIILHVANFFQTNFKGIHSLTNASCRVSLGLRRNGHHVVEFSDRDLLKHFGLRGLLKGLGKRRMEAKLEEAVKCVRPDQVWIGMGDLLDPEMLERIRQARPDARLVLYNGDQRGEAFPHLLAKAPLLDWIFLTSGGEALQWYRQAGAKNVAFFPNMTDPSIDYPRGPSDRWRSNVMFAGGLHGVPERKETIEFLADNTDIALYRALGRPSISGMDYFDALGNARIAIDFSAFPQIPRYLSDRAVHILGCGAFLLARAVPEVERLYAPGKEMETFASKEECLDKIRHYLEREEARAAIARAGHEALRTRFCAWDVVGDMLAAIEGRVPDKPWTEVIHG